jgi:hypothetical protein
MQMNPLHWIRMMFKPRLPKPVSGDMRLAKSDRGTFTVQEYYLNRWREHCGSEWATEAEACAFMQLETEGRSERRRLTETNWTPIEPTP